MNRFLWTCVAVVALAVVETLSTQCQHRVSSLNCNTCSVGILGTCLISSSKTCSADEPNCFTGKATFSVTGSFSLNSKGCMGSTGCNGTASGTIPLIGANYTVAKTCCSTNLCNAASSIQLPLTFGLSAALLAVWSSCGY